MSHWKHNGLKMIQAKGIEIHPYLTKSCFEVIKKSYNLVHLVRHYKEIMKPTYNKTLLIVPRALSPKR